jgi:hypothetical protein
MPIPEQTTNSDVIRPPVNGELDAAAKARVRRAIKVSILLETTLIALITGSMLVFGYLAYDSHQRVEAAAMLQSIQLTRAISAEIGQNLESARRAVKETVEALAIPGIWTVDPVMRNAALFGSKDLVRSLSTLAIIGTYGQLRAYSLSLVPPDTLYEEQPNFITASIDPAPGIFVSGPMHDRTTDRNVLVLTQRTNDAAGHFTGVVTGSVYMSYFTAACAEVILSRNDGIGLMYLDGAPILRLPMGQLSTYRSDDEPDILERVTHAERGAYIGRSPYDGLVRLTSFERIEQEPLFLYYSRSIDLVFAEWRRTYLATGLLLSIMWCAKIFTIRGLHVRRKQMYETANSARLEALGRLAGDVAHNVNGHFQVIASACELIRRRIDNKPEVERLCETVLKQIVRGGEITRAVLSTAKAEDEKP